MDVIKGISGVIGRALFPSQGKARLFCSRHALEDLFCCAVGGLLDGRGEGYCKYWDLLLYDGP